MASCNNLLKISFLLKRMSDMLHRVLVSLSGSGPDCRNDPVADIAMLVFLIVMVTLAISWTIFIFSSKPSSIRSFMDENKKNILTKGGIKDDKN